jgi:thiol-disulfide isomerase/thioredoxin
VFGKSFCGQVCLVLVLTACGSLRRLSAQVAPSTAAPAQPAAEPSSKLPGAAEDTGIEARSPSDLYREARHPLEVVRRSLDNWSDAELGALAVGMHRAGEDCAKVKPADYKGDDLFDLARLCSFGQNWDGANTAAIDYVGTRAEEHRAQAYAISVNALVRMNAMDLAVETAREMLHKLPYDAEVAYSLRDLKESLEEASNPIAVELAADEHTAILEALEQGVPLKATHGEAVIGLGELYESAMQLAFLERYYGRNEIAETTVAEVQGALPATAALPAEDRQRVNSVTARYRLLGTHVPEVKVVRSLQSANAKAQFDPNFGAATVLVLFPDWCVDCRRMMKTLTEFAAVNRDTPIHAYGLVFADDLLLSGQSAHEKNFKEMSGTQTFVVPAATTETFGATDFPTGIVLDGAGTVRFIGQIPGDAFNGDSYIGKVIVRMAHEEAASIKDNGKTK